jgi:hypothetical protein
MKSKKFDKDYRKVFEIMFESGSFNDIVFKAYFYDASNDIILAREANTDPDDHVTSKRRIMNNAVLNGYRETFFELENTLNSKFKIKKIDTSKLSMKKMVSGIAADIKSDLRTVRPKKLIREIPIKSNPLHSKIAKAKRVKKEWSGKSL